MYDEAVLVAVSYTHLDVYKRQSRDSVVDFKTGTPLALGAALGGV